MKLNVLFTLILICSFSCERRNREYFLLNGLEGYRKARTINQFMVEGYEINKVGFVKTEKGKLELIVKLNDEIEQETINKYSLGLYAYANNKYLSYKQNELHWNVHPKFYNIGSSKYLIDTINLAPTKMDSLVFYLFDRDKYRKIIGNRVVLKNIAI